MMKKFSVYAAIIGGGAAGMMCALRAAQRYPGRRIVIIEKADRVGKKLLVTGNGRCNLSNMNATADSYHGEGSGAVVNILLMKYNPAAVVRYFNELGLLTYADREGRVYPRTNLASSVLDVLRLNLKLSGVEELCGADITDVRREKDSYIISVGGELITAERLVLASGGQADYTGRSIGGASLSDMLGLSVTAFSPSLSPVRVRGDVLRSLKGIRADASVSLIKDDKTVKAERGEVQFTDGALSGICVFDLSREANRGGCEISVDLLPDMDKDAVLAELNTRIGRSPSSPVSDIFIGMSHKNIGLALLKQCGIQPSAACSDISDKELKSLCKIMTDWRFVCEKSTDFRKAQVTAGGVSLSEINLLTFEVMRSPGLYVIGEALDVDGDCGGYNLQFAWASALCAGDNL